MRYEIPHATSDPPDPAYLKRLQDLDCRSFLLDSRYRIPFTRVRFGWDAIIGLLPVVGDFVTAAISLHLVYHARSLGADRRAASHMVLNTAVDALLGTIPIVGTIFDVYFRANERNLQLLIDHIERHRHS
jgi:hypothetical protein